MTTREALHEAIDRLPDRRLDDALMLFMHLLAAEEDESVEFAEDAAAAAALEEYRAGRTIPAAEARQQLLDG